MSKTIIIFLNAIIIAITVSFNAFASKDEEVKNYAYLCAEAFTDQLTHIRNSNNEVIPLGMNMDKSVVRDVVFGINSGLYMMDRIEKLPLSFGTPESIEIPVLLYHHITLAKGYGDSVMSLELFKEHLDTIKTAGYNTVSLQ